MILRILTERLPTLLCSGFGFWIVCFTVTEQGVRKAVWLLLRLIWSVFKHDLKG